MDLFLKISVLHANFCWLGDVEEIIVLGRKVLLGKKIIQGVRRDLKSRIAATGYLYGLLTTQDLNCALWNFPVSQVAGCKVAGWELFHQSCWEWGTDNFFPAISQNAWNSLRKLYSRFVVLFLGLFLKISRWVPLSLFAASCTSMRAWTFSLANAVAFNSRNDLLWNLWVF